MLLTNKYSKPITIFWLLSSLLLVACATPATRESEAAISLAPTVTLSANRSELADSLAASGTPIVEYGASLNEWETAARVNESVLAPAVANNAANATTAQQSYLEIQWDNLVPADYRAEAIMARYQDELNKFADGDPEAMNLYMQMQEEFNNAPVNQSLNNANIKLPGFIAPLEYVDGIITEFLLVPYFGACIHVPPPPPNQTVWVKVAEGQGIRFEDSYYPVWVSGQLVAESTTTNLADAGYYVHNALIEPYSYSP